MVGARFTARAASAGFQARSRARKSKDPRWPSRPKEKQDLNCCQGPTRLGTRCTTRQQNILFRSLLEIVK
eukprot:4391661-Amphidinium_carterae.1